LKDNLSTNGRLSRRHFTVLFSTSLLSACGGAMGFPVNDNGQAALAERGVNIIRVTADNIALYANTKSDFIRSIAANPPPDPAVYVYAVGVGDQLRVRTWAGPERQAGSDQGGLSEGPVVNESGEFFYPYVGMTKARGRSVAQIRDELESALRVYIANLQVEIEVQEFKAHTVNAVGEVATPGPTRLTNVPLRLLDLINAAGTTEDADLARVQIRRRGTAYTVNLRSFIDYGTARQNPILLPGDVVFVPASGDNKVFVFGEIGTAGELSLGSGRMTLTEVLAKKGGLDRTRADARGVFVFRRPAGRVDGFDVFQFDLTDATALMITSQFAMSPMDVVFVTTDPIARWNDTGTRLLGPVSSIVSARTVVEKLSE
jgi:polysaccharide biosynthesis/export protein